MKKVIITLAAIFAVTAQAGELYKQIDESGEMQDVTWTQRKGKKKIRNKEVSSVDFEIKPRAVRKLKAAKRDKIRIPFVIEGNRIVFSLIKQPESVGDIGIHYVGSSKSDDRSSAAISVYDHNLEGVLQYKGKAYSLNTQGVTASLTDTTDLPIEATLEGDVLEAPNAKDFPQTAEAPPVAENTAPVINSSFPVRIGIEIDHQMFLTLGSDQTRARTLVETLINARNAYYLNEGIAMQAFIAKIWTTPDPYSNYTAGATNSINSTLYQFASKALRYGGAHLMELLTIRPGWGGIAYLDVLGNPYIHHSVSSIYSTYTPNPIYTWPLNVMVHEIGHNLSSRHTHNCSWVRNNQANQALDGCFTPEGSCPRPTNPVGFKGTVMSYCHLSNSMDMTLGFGEQPLARIKDAIQRNASFLGSSGGGADTVAPIVTLTTPSSGQTLVGVGSRRTVSFIADARDDRAMGRVEFQISGGNIQQATGQSTILLQASGLPYAISLNTRDYGMNNGQYVVRVRAIDSANNASAWSANTLFTLNNAPIDTTPPVITIQQPAPNTNWSSGQMRFVFSATDNVAVTSMIAYYNGKLFGSRSGGLIDTTLNFGDLGTSGIVAFDVRAFDADGSMAQRTFSMTLGGADVTKPTVQITSPLANQVVSGAVNFTANASDNVGVAKVDFYADSTLLSSDTSVPYSAVYATTAANNGSRVLKAIATDAAGNTGEGTVTVSVSNSVQQFNILSSSVGQNKAAPATKREWIDLKLTGLVGTPTFQGRAVTNTAWSAKTGADAVLQANGDWRIFFFNPNTNYEVKAICTACSPVVEKIQAFKSLP